MTRDWSFTLPVANQWYNLWKDLISKDTSFTDSTFSNAPFVPNRVCEFKYQNQTAGSNVQLSDSKKEVGMGLTGGSWDVQRSNRNTIDLTNKNFQTDTAGTVLYVAIAAN